MLIQGMWELTCEGDVAGGDAGKVKVGEASQTM